MNDPQSQLAPGRRRVPDRSECLHDLAAASVSVASAPEWSGLRLKVSEGEVHSRPHLAGRLRNRVRIIALRLIPHDQ